MKFFSLNPLFLHYMLDLFYRLKRCCPGKSTTG